MSYNEIEEKEKALKEIKRYMRKHRLKEHVDLYQLERDYRGSGFVVHLVEAGETIIAVKRGRGYKARKS